MFHHHEYRRCFPRPYFHLFWMEARNVEDARTRVTNALSGTDAYVVHVWRTGMQTFGVQLNWNFNSTTTPEEAFARVQDMFPIYLYQNSRTWPHSRHWCGRCQ